MSKMIYGISRTFSSSVTGILLYLKLVWALETPSIVQPEEVKVIGAADLSFPRGDGKLPVLAKCQSLLRIYGSEHLWMFWQKP